MRFIYSYKTSTNEWRDDTIIAASRQQAFSVLKGNGIKPIKLELAPGILNKLLSFGWSAVIILVLLFLLLIAGILLYNINIKETVHAQSEAALVAGINDSARRQIYGDRAYIDVASRKGWDECFSDVGSKFLARFVQPGWIVKDVEVPSDEQLLSALKIDVDINERDGIENRQVKQIVRGMKLEMSEFIKAGGSVSRYVYRLWRRQKEESDYYTRCCTELSVVIERDGFDKGMEYWEAANESLRSMGIMTMQLPD